MYRKLDPGLIVETLERLERRIGERFPGSGLAKVAAELSAVARQTQQRAAEIARPDLRLRVLVGALMLAGVWLLGAVLWSVLSVTRPGNELFGTLQGIDSGFNIVVLMGAALFFMFSIEERLKRRRVLKALNELRSIVHVVDMHQLLKDPSVDAVASEATPSSPPRPLRPYALVRYLEYCTELLSLAAKVAVLYSQSFPDPIVAEAVNDLERTALGLGQKIWQKIAILRREVEAAGR